MRWTFLILCAGFFITTFVLFLEDYQITAGVERLSEMRVTRNSSLSADPNLRLVSEQAVHAGRALGESWQKALSTPSPVPGKDSYAPRVRRIPSWAEITLGGRLWRSTS